MRAGENSRERSTTLAWVDTDHPFHSVWTEVPVVVVIELDLHVINARARSLAERSEADRQIYL
jgi:hypothetical protein